MNLRIYDRLDPVFETLGLLYFSYKPDSYRKGTIEDLNTFGLDGEVFYNKHLKIIEKYILTFSKHRVLEPEATFFLDDNDNAFFHLLHALLSEHPDWLTSLEEIPEKIIRDQLVKAIYSMEAMQNHSPVDAAPVSVRTLDEILTFLSHSPLQETTKWKLMRLLYQPRTQLLTFAGIVKSNLPAFEQACLEVEKPLSKLIPAYVKSVSKQYDEQFARLVEMLDDENPVIYPSLIVPLGQMMLSGRAYYGLYVDELPIASKQHSDSRELLLLRIKALADNSKLQILASLKVSPKYNLEIADQLGLTAATTSHHMNVLLACGMVRVEKNNGRVYYHLNTENLQVLIDDLQQFLL